GGVREARPALPRGTSTLRTDRFTMIGATWTGSVEPRVQFSVRGTDGWGGWRDLPTLHDGPTAATEGNGVRGTDLVWAGATSAVRVRTQGRRPAGLRLVLLDTSGTAGAPTSRAAVAPAKQAKQAKPKRKSAPPP